MKFKDFLELYDNWNGTIRVNDNNLNMIVEGNTCEVYEGNESLYDKEVVAFGFYDGILTVRVRQEIDLGFWRRKEDYIMNEVTYKPPKVIRDVALNELSKDIEKLAKLLVTCRDITGWDEIPTYEYITSDGTKFDDDSYVDVFHEAVEYEIKWLNAKV